MKKSQTIDIGELIRCLEEEKARGADTVTLWGTATLTADEPGCSSVLMATEPQM